jgi:hypothetical protein
VKSGSEMVLTANRSFITSAAVSPDSINPIKTSFNIKDAFIFSIYRPF